MHIWGKTHHFFKDAQLRHTQYYLDTYQLIQFSDLTQRTIGSYMTFMFLCWEFPSSQLARQCLRIVSLILIKFRTRIDFFKKEMITQLSNSVSYLFSFQLFVYTKSKQCTNFGPTGSRLLIKSALFFRYLDISHPVVPLSISMAKTIIIFYYLLRDNQSRQTLSLTIFECIIWEKMLDHRFSIQILNFPPSICTTEYNTSSTRPLSAAHAFS